jgi:sn-glycerol 3-phosphate transport system substrate-binding protein
MLEIVEFLFDRNSECTNSKGGKMSEQEKCKRTLTRREFLRVATITTAGVVLSACSGNPIAAPTTVPTAAAVKAAATAASAAPTIAAAATAAPKVTVPAVVSGKIELVWWRALEGAVATAMETLAKQFTEKNPDVTIKVYSQGTYEQMRDKLLAAAAAKQMPDLALMGGVYWAPFARNNLFEPLDDYIKGSDGIDLKDYFPFVDRGMRDGKYYQLPLAVSAPLFLINADMVKAAGFAMPSDKWTWDDHYDSVIPKLTIKEGSKYKVYGHAYATTTPTWRTQQEIWSYGSQMSDDKYMLYFDTPEMIRQWKRWQKLTLDGHNHIPTQAEGTNLQLFVNQLAATAWVTTGNLQQLDGLIKDKFKWSVLAPPYGPQGRFVSEGGSGLHMVAGLSKEKRDAAWRFIKYTQAPEQVAYFAKSTGYMAFTNKSKALLGDFLKENPNFNVAYEALGSGGRRNELFNDCVRVQTLIWDTLERLIGSTQDVETTLRQLQKEATAIMIDEGYQKK